MENLRATALIIVCAIVTFVGLSSQRGRATLAAPADVPVSTDVGKLPFRNDLSVKPLTVGPGLIDAQAAVTAATASFGLSVSNVDSGIGVVSALLTKGRMKEYQDRKVWITTFDVTIPAPVNGIVYHKLSVVVDALTGRYLFAYSGDPTFK